MDFEFLDTAIDARLQKADPLNPDGMDSHNDEGGRHHDSSSHGNRGVGKRTTRTILNALRQKPEFDHIKPDSELENMSEAQLHDELFRVTGHKVGDNAEHDAKLVEAARSKADGGETPSADDVNADKVLAIIEEPHARDPKPTATPVSRPEPPASVEEPQPQAQQRLDVEEKPEPVNVDSIRPAELMPNIPAKEPKKPFDGANPSPSNLMFSMAQVARSKDASKMSSDDFIKDSLRAYGQIFYGSPLSDSSVNKALERYKKSPNAKVEAAANLFRHKEARNDEEASVAWQAAQNAADSPHFMHHRGQDGVNHLLDDNGQSIFSYRSQPKPPRQAPEQPREIAEPPLHIAEDGTPNEAPETPSEDTPLHIAEDGTPKAAEVVTPSEDDQIDPEYASAQRALRGMSPEEINQTAVQFADFAEQNPNDIPLPEAAAVFMQASPGRKADDARDSINEDLATVMANQLGGNLPELLGSIQRDFDAMNHAERQFRNPSVRPAIKEALGRQFDAAEKTVRAKIGQFKNEVNGHFDPRSRDALNTESAANDAVETPNSPEDRLVPNTPGESPVSETPAPSPELDIDAIKSEADRLVESSKLATLEAAKTVNPDTVYNVEAALLPDYDPTTASFAYSPEQIKAHARVLRDLRREQRGFDDQAVDPSTVGDEQIGTKTESGKLVAPSEGIDNEVFSLVGQSFTDKDGDKWNVVGQDGETITGQMWGTTEEKPFNISDVTFTKDDAALESIRAGQSHIYGDQTRAIINSLRDAYAAKRKELTEEFVDSARRFLATNAPETVIDPDTGENKPVNIIEDIERSIEEQRADIEMQADLAASSEKQHYEELVDELGLMDKEAQGESIGDTLDVLKRNLNEALQDIGRDKNFNLTNLEENAYVNALTEVPKAYDFSYSARKRSYDLKKALFAQKALLKEENDKNTSSERILQLRNESSAADLPDQGPILRSEFHGQQLNKILDDIKNGADPKEVAKRVDKIKADLIKYGVKVPAKTRNRLTDPAEHNLFLLTSDLRKSPEQADALINDFINGKGPYGLNKALERSLIADRAANAKTYRDGVNLANLGDIGTLSRALFKELPGGALDVNPVTAYKEAAKKIQDGKGTSTAKQEALEELASRTKAFLYNGVADALRDQGLSDEEVKSRLTGLRNMIQETANNKKALNDARKAALSRGTNLNNQRRKEFIQRANALRSGPAAVAQARREALDNGLTFDRANALQWVDQYNKISRALNPGTEDYRTEMKDRIPDDVVNRTEHFAARMGVNPNDKVYDYLRNLADGPESATDNDIRYALATKTNAREGLFDNLDTSAFDGAQGDTKSVLDDYIAAQFPSPDEPQDATPTESVDETPEVPAAVDTNDSTGETPRLNTPSEPTPEPPAEAPREVAETPDFNIDDLADNADELARLNRNLDVLDHNFKLDPDIVRQQDNDLSNSVRRFDDEGAGIPDRLARDLVFHNIDQLLLRRNNDRPLDEAALRNSIKEMIGYQDQNGNIVRGKVDLGGQERRNGTYGTGSIKNYLNPNSRKQSYDSLVDSFVNYTKLRQNGEVANKDQALQELRDHGKAVTPAISDELIRAREVLRAERALNGESEPSPSLDEVKDRLYGTKTPRRAAEEAVDEAFSEVDAAPDSTDEPAPESAPEPTPEPPAETPDVPADTTPQEVLPDATDDGSVAPGDNLDELPGSLNEDIDTESLSNVDPESVDTVENIPEENLDDLGDLEEKRLQNNQEILALEMALKGTEHPLTAEQITQLQQALSDKYDKVNEYANRISALQGGDSDPVNTLDRDRQIAAMLDPNVDEENPFTGSERYKELAKYENELIERLNSTEDRLNRELDEFEGAEENEKGKHVAAINDLKRQKEKIRRQMRDARNKIDSFSGWGRNAQDLQQDDAWDDQQEQQARNTLEQMETLRESWKSGIPEGMKDLRAYTEPAKKVNPAAKEKILWEHLRQMDPINQLPYREFSISGSDYGQKKVADSLEAARGRWKSTRSRKAEPIDQARVNFDSSLYKLLRNGKTNPVGGKIRFDNDEYDTKDEAIRTLAARALTDAGIYSDHNMENLIARSKIWQLNDGNLNDLKDVPAPQAREAAQDIIDTVNKLEAVADKPLGRPGRKFRLMDEGTVKSIIRGEAKPRIDWTPSDMSTYIRRDLGLTPDTLRTLSPEERVKATSFEPSGEDAPLIDMAIDHQLSEDISPQRRAILRVDQLGISGDLNDTNAQANVNEIVTGELTDLSPTAQQAIGRDLTARALVWARKGVEHNEDDPVTSTQLEVAANNILNDPTFKHVPFRAVEKFRADESYVPPSDRSRESIADRAAKGPLDDIDLQNFGLFEQLPYVDFKAIGQNVGSLGTALSRRAGKIFTKSDRGQHTAWDAAAANFYKSIAGKNLSDEGLERAAREAITNIYSKFKGIDGDGETKARSAWERENPELIGKTYFINTPNKFGGARQLGLKHRAPLRPDVWEDGDKPTSQYEEMVKQLRETGKLLRDGYDGSERSRLAALDLMEQIDDVEMERGFNDKSNNPAVYRRAKKGAPTTPTNVEPTPNDTEPDPTEEIPDVDVSDAPPVEPASLRRVVTPEPKQETAMDRLSESLAEAAANLEDTVKPKEEAPAVVDQPASRRLSPVRAVDAPEPTELTPEEENEALSVLGFEAYDKEFEDETAVAREDLGTVVDTARKKMEEADISDFDKKEQEIMRRIAADKIPRLRRKAWLEDAQEKLLDRESSLFTSLANEYQKTPARANYPKNPLRLKLNAVHGALRVILKLLL